MALIPFAVMGGSITVREARPDELDAVAALLAESYAQYMPGPDDDVDEELRAAFDRYRQDIVDVRSRLENSDLLVAERDGELLGAVTFYPPAGGSHYPADDVREWPPEYASFRLLGVPPRARGNGIGKVLTNACIDRARELGAAAVGLHTTMVMEVARAMYQRMGFARVPEYDFYPVPDFCVEAYVLEF